MVRMSARREFLRIVVFPFMVGGNQRADQLVAAANKFAGAYNLWVEKMVESFPAIRDEGAVKFWEERIKRDLGALETAYKEWAGQ